MVQPAAKWTMIIGGLVLLGSGILMGVGGVGALEDIAEDPETQWEGTAPTTTNLTLVPGTLHTVFIESNSDVEISVSPGVSFTACDQDGSCGMYSRDGMTYIGKLDVQESGIYEVDFTGNGSAMKMV